jgi:hypothetical protein
MRPPSDQTDEETDRERRRTKRRRHFEEHGVSDARVRPGSEAIVIDVSAGGVLIETCRRLLPGAPIELQLISGTGRVVVRGRVIWCSVSRIGTGCIWYRGGIAFDRHLPWFVDDGSGGYGVPGVEMRAGRHRREEATHHVL